jgi:signal transduction histidine kinase
MAARPAARRHAPRPGARAAASLALSAAAPAAACAQSPPENVDLRLDLLEIADRQLGAVDPVTVSALGVIFFVTLATVLSVLHIWQRRLWQKDREALEARAAALDARLELAEQLSRGDRFALVRWPHPAAEPEIEGDVAFVVDPIAPRRVLGFGAWTNPRQAKALETAVIELRERGVAFDLTVDHNGGGVVEVAGRPVGGVAVLRFRDVQGERRALRLLEAETRARETRLRGLERLLDAAATPAWLRDETDRLSFVNRAYAAAVGVASPAEAIERQIELLERDARRAAAAARARGEEYRDRVKTVIGGRRHPVRVLEVTIEGGAAGAALDLSEFEGRARALEDERALREDTIQSLPCGVAVFDEARKLVFHNEAYAGLLRLPPPYLAGLPSEADILERLRASGGLPHQVDFRAWKHEWLAAYDQPVERRVTWSLTDRQIAIRALPNRLGGMTYILEDATASASLESRMRSLGRVQSETLDSLQEGVAVFGANGRLKLANPAFTALWRLPADLARTEPHIDAIIAAAASRGAGEGWARLREEVTSLREARRDFRTRFALEGDVTVDVTAMPLRDGGTMIAFADVSASVRVNELQTAFIRNVGSSLRDPLNAVDGFGQLLATGVAGPLNERQQSYADAVCSASANVVSLLDDILDISGIEAGAIELARDEVEIAGLLADCLPMLRLAAAQRQVRLEIAGAEPVGRLRGDERRLRQAITSLVQGAIEASGQDETVSLRLGADGAALTVEVSDAGGGRRAGLDENQGQAFDRRVPLEREASFRIRVARTIIERSGGALDIVLNAERGARVTMRYPLLAETVAGRAARAAG